MQEPKRFVDDGYRVYTKEGVNRWEPEYVKGKTLEEVNALYGVPNRYFHGDGNIREYEESGIVPVQEVHPDDFQCGDPNTFDYWERILRKGSVMLGTDGAVWPDDRTLMYLRMNEELTKGDKAEVFGLIPGRKWYPMNWSFYLWVPAYLRDIIGAFCAVRQREKGWQLLPD